jgi:hypothetical protein
MAAQLRAVTEVSGQPLTSDLAADRERLRAAIARVNTAEQAVTLAEQARALTHSAYLSALRSLDTARDALREAEADNQQHRVAHLLGEMTGAPALSELRRAIELAETVAAGARSDEELLDAEIRRRRQALDLATHDRDQAVAEVLRPAAEALQQRIRDALAAVAALRGALAVFPLDCLPAYWDAATTYAEDVALNMRWRDVIETLTTDADAPIPEEITK